MPYFPHTAEEKKEMLAVCGVADVDELFAHLPAEVRCGPLKLPSGLSEMETAAELRRLADSNRPTPVCFLGAGAYDHFIPAAVDELTGRGEFYTAYTPYQPEISQGALQAIYEYQTAMAALCGLDAANASLYDGATALVEACAAAVAAAARSGRGTVVMDGTVHPHYLRTVRTMLPPRGVKLVVVPPRDGGFQSDWEGMQAAAADSDTAAVVLGYPNFYGALFVPAELIAAARASKVAVVACSNPFLFGVLEPPGAFGADLVCGEAQPFGVPLNYGGPYLGYLACRKEWLRRLPGRVVGRTKDAAGRTAFTLTLQAREQHIRRERATSNICSNQALCALRAWVHLSCLGASGLRRANELALARAAALREGLRKLASASESVVAGVPAYPAGYEFVYETKKPAAEVLAMLRARGVLGGLDLGRYDPARRHQVLTCATEKRTPAEVEVCLKALSEMK